MEKINLQLVCETSEKTFTKDKKEYNYHNYFLVLDNGYRIQVTPIFKNDHATLKTLANQGLTFYVTWSYGNEYKDKEGKTMRYVEYSLVNPNGTRVRIKALNEFNIRLLRAISYYVC